MILPHVFSLIFNQIIKCDINYKMYYHCRDIGITDPSEACQFCFRHCTRVFPHVSLFYPHNLLWKILLEPFCWWSRWDFKRWRVCDHGLSAIWSKDVVNIGDAQLIVRTRFKASKWMNPLWNTCIILKYWVSIYPSPAVKFPSYGFWCPGYLKLPYSHQRTQVRI